MESALPEPNQHLVTNKENNFEPQSYPFFADIIKKKECNTLFKAHVLSQELEGLELFKNYYVGLTSMIFLTAVSTFISRLVILHPCNETLFINRFDLAIFIMIAIHFSMSLGVSFLKRKGKILSSPVYLFRLFKLSTLALLHIIELLQIFIFLEEKSLFNVFRIQAVFVVYSVGVLKLLKKYNQTLFATFSMMLIFSIMTLAECKNDGNGVICSIILTVGALGLTWKLINDSCTKEEKCVKGLLKAKKKIEILKQILTDLPVALSIFQSKTHNFIYSNKYLRNLFHFETQENAREELPKLLRNSVFYEHTTEIPSNFFKIKQQQEKAPRKPIDFFGALTELASSEEQRRSLEMKIRSNSSNCGQNSILFQDNSSCQITNNYNYSHLPTLNLVTNNSYNHHPKSSNFLLANGHINHTNSDEFRQGCLRKKSPMSPKERSIVIHMQLLGRICIVLMEDVTDRENSQKHDDSSSFKSKLMTSISHELKTPLNGSIGLIEFLLLEKNISSKVKQDYLLPSLRSLNLLDHLINDILDYGQFFAGQLKMNFGVVNVRKAVAQAIELIELQAAKKEHALNFECEEHIEEDFITDRNRLQQILINLLTNAIKFTDKGGSISVSVKKVAFEPQSFPNLLQFSVKDTGIGIKPSRQTWILMELERRDFSLEEKDKEKGCGLGLAISQILASLLGPAQNSGLTFESSAKGTEFTFVIEPKTSEYKPMHPRFGALNPKARYMKTMEHIPGKKLDMESTLTNSIIDRQTKKVSMLGLKSQEKESKFNLDYEHIEKALKISKVQSEIEIPEHQLPGINTVNSMDVASNNRFELSFSNPRSLNSSGRGLSIAEERKNSTSCRRSRSSMECLNETSMIRASDAGYKKALVKEDLKESPEQSVINSCPSPSEKAKEINSCIGLEEENTDSQNNFILIVDDDSFNLHVMKTIIKKLGYDCKLCYSGKEAIAFVNGLIELKGLHNLKLILMDYLMPEMDGCECTTQIKNLIRPLDLRFDIPVIAVTANDDAAVYEKCMECGMVELVAKPVNMEKMEKIFELWIN